MGKSIFACGVVIFAAMVAISAIEAREEIPFFLLLTGVASAGYLTALWLVSRDGKATGRELAICLILALTWRLPLMAFRAFALR